MTSGRMIELHEKEAIGERLNGLNKGYWLSLRSHIWHDGEEVFFSFLIDNREHMSTILDLFLQESSALVAACPGTDFNMGIYTFQEDQEILLESFSDDEIRHPDEIDYPLGEEPSILNRRLRKDWWGV